MSKTIPVWRIGPVNIFPHLSWDGCLDNQELVETAQKIKSELSDLNVKIHEQSTYCSEVNGPWNVVISISSKENGTTIKYIYMIRRDSELSKTFGCPLINTEYFMLHERPLSKCYNELLFDSFEKALIKVLGNGTSIDVFET